MDSLPARMKAMVLPRPGATLELRELPVPHPGSGEVLVRVRACGVCRTDLHLVDGELPDPALPVVPGHEIVGEVVALGAGTTAFEPGERVGVPWLGSTCGLCPPCVRGEENLCDAPYFTGYTRDGGYAEYAVADARYCFTLPSATASIARAAPSDAELAPLLCAGLIGYRSLRMAGEGVRRLGIYGFGAAAHIVAQIATHRGMELYAFTRPGDAKAQAFARSLGAVWAGASDALPPVELDAALLFAPVGDLVPTALAATRKGGAVICGGIHMSDIPSFPYRLLWGERLVRSVANLTRRDGEELLAIAAEIPVRTHVTTYPLVEANRALEHVRRGLLEGAAVLIT